MTLAPHSAADVVQRSAALAAAFRSQHAPVVYVRVNLGDMLTHLADKVTRDPNAPPPPVAASELVAECGYQDGDLRITKRQWGAFTDTGLDQQLRRRAIKTLVLGGLVTNFGVESTARAARDLGYDVVFAEDAMSTVSAEMHRFAVGQIFPYLGRVRTSSEIAEGLA